MAGEGLAADAPAADASARGIGHRRRTALWLIAWLVASVLLWVSLRSVDVASLGRELRSARPLWLLVAVGCNASIIAMWAAQSLVFVPRGHRVRFARMFEVTALTTTATNTIPALLGHASGVVVMAERTAIGTAAALAVLAQHQAVEGIAKVATVIVAAHIAPFPPSVQQAVAGFALGVIVLIAVLFVAARHAGRAPVPTAPAAPGATRRSRLRAGFTKWASGLESLRTPRRFALGLAIALGMKLAEAGGHAAVMRALDVRAPAGTPAVALAAVTLASSLSASPGNVGTYEAAAAFAYRRMGVAPDRAAALALAAHLCYLLPFVGGGWLILSARQLARLRRR